MNEGASRGLGLQSMMLELGIEVKLFLMTDSAAAKSFSSTRGLRRMRHVEVQDLWLQELVQKGRLHVLKINGLVNVADTLTKYHDQVTCSNLLAGAGLRVVPVMIAHSQSEGVVLNDGATVTRPAGRKTRGRKVCECAHQTVSPLVVRAVWRSQFPPVMTTSCGSRTAGASRKKTGGCDRKPLCPSLFFFLSAVCA